MSEEWKRIAGFTDYEASPLGQIRKGERLIKANVGSHGYLTRSTSSWMVIQMPDPRFCRARKRNKL